MSNSSDSEEFFDAEDDSNNKLRKAKTSCGVTPSKSKTDFQLCLKKDEQQKDVFKAPVRIPCSSAVLTTVSSDFQSYLQNQCMSGKHHFSSCDKTTVSRSRLKELRKRMQTEDEEPLTATGNSPTGSQTSSLDGVFPDLETKSSHPFRIIEHDALSLHSLTSLGRSARILSANQETLNSLSAKESMLTNIGSSGVSSNKATTDSSPKDESKSCQVQDKSEQQVVNLQEPDVIASTKTGSLSSIGTPPIAPPRRKKKIKNKVNPPNTLPLDKQPQQPPLLTKSVSADEGSYSRDSTLPSPSFTIESLAREFENSLDITSAVRGDYVVRPSDPPPDLPSHDSSRSNESEAVRPSSRRNRVGSRNSSTYPLGASATSPSPMRERRRSAGDEKSLLKANTSTGGKQDSKMFVRTRTDSGKPLSDLEILEQVTVLNLDTGERVPLSIAEDKLPQCINPLSLHIMRLTSEYVSNTSLEKDKESDGESIDSRKSLPLGRSTVGKDTTERRSYQIRKFLGQTVKRTVIRAMGRQNKEEGLEVENENQQQQPPGEQYIKLKASNSHKGPYEFDCLQHVQELSGEHQGPVWCMKFSSCGRLLATAGQDKVLRIWVVTTAYPYFQEMRTKYNGDRVSPSPSQESLASQLSENCPEASTSEDSRPVPFCPKPFCTYSGHTSDLLDISWSKNYFVLSSSMDKTVRLWHISRKECLCCFQHIEFVTAIVFHPRDDRYFLSGSLDGKLRLWNIPDKKVAVWNEVDGQTKLITAANFCQNGKFAVVGSYDGRCIFYITDQLKYHTQIHVRSSRGKNSTGRKISGIEPMPGEDKILVTSNDSRIRLYDLRDLNLSCKYKGYVNMSSQIKASFSHDGKYIVSGSENQCIYIWKSTHDYSKFTSVRRDRNDYWEGIKVHNATVTCAIFSPNPDIIMKHVLQDKDSNTSGYVLVSADFNGSIKVFINKTKPKHSSLPASAIA